MAQGWSIGGTRVEVRPAFPSGKVVLLGPTGQVEREVVLAEGGESKWPLTLAGLPFELVRVKKLLGSRVDLVARDGQVIPTTGEFVSPRPAPAGSQCQPDSAKAAAACARCAAFVCQRCIGADLTHCRACFELTKKAAAREAAAVAWTGPAVGFIIIGGGVGAMLGALAGYATYSVAKRTDRTVLKVAAAVCFYGLAAALWLVVASVLQAAKHD